jgi:ubiquinone biosynthesis protein
MTARPGTRDPHLVSGHSHRQRQIAEVLVRQGFGYLLEALGFEHLRSVERGLRGLEPRDAVPAPAERLRLALEELGPTFIKIGQLASTRPDLLSPEYRLELVKLQDAAPHLPAQVVRDTIESELGGSVQSAFGSFDPEPLAAASIGQAHAATLPDGTEVVVKVRRPRVVEEVEQDLEILKNLAARAHRRWKPASRLDLVGLADELAQSLRAELDYLHEGRNAERIAASFADDPDAQIPKVFWETTTSRVITLERIRGMKITDVAALDAAGIDRRELAQRATRVMAKMVFEDGFFHADPHPGNYFIQPGGRIALIDFGMVGTLSDRTRDQLGRLLVALVRHDSERVARALLTLGTSTGPVDLSRLSNDLEQVLSQYWDKSLRDMALGTVSGELMDVARRHGLTLPRDLALLIKALIEEEGVAAEVDPDYRIIEGLAPYASRHLAAQLSPAALAKRMERVGLDLAELSVDLPAELHRVLDRLSAGDLEIHLRPSELEPLMARTERLGNRVVASILAAAAIDGLAHFVAAGWGRRPRGRTPKLPAVLRSGGAPASRASETRANRRRRRR